MKEEILKEFTKLSEILRDLGITSHVSEHTGRTFNGETVINVQTVAVRWSESHGANRLHLWTELASLSAILVYRIARYVQVHRANYVPSWEKWQVLLQYQKDAAVMAGELATELYLHGRGAS